MFLIDKLSLKLISDCKSSQFDELALNGTKFNVPNNDNVSFFSGSVNTGN